MPLPAIVGPAIGAASSIVNNLLNAGSNKRENRRNREFAEYMYGVQRQDALEDWAMQNEYNSPKAQMQRFRDAGLNPNLIYGQTQEASSPRAASAATPQGQATRYDLSGVGNSIMSYQDIKLKEAQTDNLQVQNRVIAQDALLKAAQTVKTLSEGKSAQFDYEMKEHLKQMSVDAASEAVRKLKSEVDINELNLELGQRLFDTNIKKAQAEMQSALNNAQATQHQEKRALAELDLLIKDRDLKQFQINLNRLGINASDPAILRIITQLFGSKVKTN